MRTQLQWNIKQMIGTNNEQWANKLHEIDNGRAHQFGIAQSPNLKKADPRSIKGEDYITIHIVWKWLKNRK